jgi:hypothetical protein
MATGRIGTTPVLTTRWSKAPAAGTTSLSGLDDNSVSLVYSVGYEAVYQNGVLLSRGNDYTATNGTTITLTTATVAGDIIEVFANQTIPLTDTYSQTVSDGRFIKNTLTTTTGDIIYASAANTPARLGIGSTSQVLTVSGGVPSWATPSSGGLTLISTTSLSGASTTINFGNTYTNLLFLFYTMENSTADGKLTCYFNAGSTNNSGVYSTGSTTTSYNDTTIRLSADVNLSRTNAVNTIGLYVTNYNSTALYQPFQVFGGLWSGGRVSVNGAGMVHLGAALTSLTVSNSGGNFSAGSVALYGVK